MKNKMIKKGKHTVANYSAHPRMSCKTFSRKQKNLLRFFSFLFLLFFSFIIFSSVRNTDPERHLLNSQMPRLEQTAVSILCGNDD